MASPTPLGTDGFLGSGSVYDAGGPVSSPIAFTTTADIPASTDDNPVVVYLICQVAPVGYAGHDSANAGELYTISDGLGNTYSPIASRSASGNTTYGFGAPALVLFAGFQDGETEQAFPEVGGASFYIYSCVPDVAIPSGTTIEVDFPGAGSDPAVTWAAATMLGWQNTDTGGVSALCARGVDSSNPDQGNGGTDPLSSIILSEVIPNDTFAGFAYVFACDCPGSLDTPAVCAGDAIDGTQTIDDLGGQWTKVDSGAASSTSFWGGVVYSVFTIDGAVADLTAQADQFVVSPFGDGFHPGGILIFNLPYDETTPAGIPAASRVFPV